VEGLNRGHSSSQGDDYGKSEKNIRACCNSPFTQAVIKGTENPRFSLEDIGAIYEIQSTLEGMAAGLAVKRMGKMGFPGEERHESYR